MLDEAILIGEEGYDTEAGCTVWWDGTGWSYTRPVQPLAAQTRPSHIPLSFAQQRLWFLSQLSSSSVEYNIPQAMRLRGPVNVTAMEMAVNAIVARHESLRTRFVDVSGTPEQIVDNSLQIAIPVEQRRGLEEHSRLQTMAEAARKEAGEPFDLSRGPLLRAKLLELDDEDHLLLITLHHIVSDGWSSSILSREFALLYEAFCEGRENPLTPLPVQYADFTLWQRNHLEGGALASGLEYWKEELAGIPARLELPSDRPRPPVQTFAAGVGVAHLSPDQLAAFQPMLQAGHATLYMALLASFAVLLERYTGQQDIVVGTPIANRLDAQLEDLIGFFVNSLVMRVRVNPDLTFRELLGQVKQTTLDAYDHQDVPFERIVGELSPERSLNASPLFQVVFALQNAPSRPQSLKGLQLEPVAVEEMHARFDLDVNAVESESGLDIYWLYNSDLFDAWRIEQMARHHRELIENVLRSPDLPLRRFAILSDTDQRRLLDDFNPAPRELRDTTVVQLFEEQVERNPAAVALVHGEERLSYRSLNARANRLANHLIAMGAGPEAFIGICLDRSIEMVVALLAVLKAGAAYVPLDPAYPEARLEYMVADAAPLLILSATAVQRRLPNAARILPLDAADTMQAVSEASEQNPLNRERTFPLLSRHPAYMMYTSGSTGKPKGVVVEHRSIVTFAAWAGSIYTPEEWSGVLASTSICFDLSVFELLLTPIHGGTVILAASALELQHLAARDQVRLVNTVPSAAQTLLELRALPSGVRTVNLCGEILRGSLVQGLYGFEHIERVYNLYGPTEDTTYSTISLCSRDSAGDPDIGTPLWNSRAYVLDSQLQLSPVGVEGDLYLAGDGIARGYWRRAQRTAERFVADPHGAPAERMYRTGDRARWRVDGKLEFLGRVDHQVKIRGFRVEPGEIEAVLQEQPGIAQQTVLAREDGPGGKYLVAYVVLEKGFDPDITALRRALVERLPDYMIPSAFEFLSALPRTPNGKLDRAALPSPHRRATLPKPEDAVSASGMEQMVASVWRQVLGMEHIGLEENFFDLGGDSLLLIKLLSQLREKVSSDIATIDLFRYPKIRLLAAFLDGLKTLKPMAAKESSGPSLESPRPEDRAQKQREAVQQLAARRTQRSNGRMEMNS
ncbi:amino acid adenylation domain-containing protein [Silvibacterium bohemicum]|uniref:Amino acid adenylation domain-containing protein n=1 Tax=Silvibacterium bohemicum TaxID=1577686 RepID=A0A841JUW4_9BACT|nr:non-ribosomal peptide synthetase [Silvibacterium bohemicum]MBB6145126.1 amino acid adenylation domain-containing protein [Silvibacterium bohemicum]